MKIDAKINYNIRYTSRVYHPASGRTLTVHSDQPGLQLYTSNYMPDPENNVCVQYIFKYKQYI